jgi:hypothetical protein
MADMKAGAAKNYPLEPQMTLELSVAPGNNDFSRHLTFEDHTGARKRLKIKFRKTSALVWQIDSFPDGIDALRSLVDPGNRSYWENLFFENRGGTTTLLIRHLKLVMRYADPPGSSPEGINHAEIPMVDWDLNMSLLAGDDEIDLTEFAKRSLHGWAGLADSDPGVVRRAVHDLGKSGSDGSDGFGSNPKYGAGIDNLCSEFVSWYYHEEDVKVNGQSVKHIVGAQQLHDLFRAAGQLYRYDSGVNLQGFTHSTSGERYAPKAGDYLERRGPDGAEHSMIMYRWLPGNPAASSVDDRLNQAIVINGPWPVTLRLVKIHKDETENRKDFWLGRVD